MVHAQHISLPVCVTYATAAGHVMQGLRYRTHRYSIFQYSNLYIYSLWNNNLPGSKVLAKCESCFSKRGQTGRSTITHLRLKMGRNCGSHPVQQGKIEVSMQIYYIVKSVMCFFSNRSIWYYLHQIMLIGCAFNKCESKTHSSVHFVACNGDSNKYEVNSDVIPHSLSQILYIDYISQVRSMYVRILW